MGLADFIIKLGLDTRQFSSNADKAKTDIKGLAASIDGSFDGLKKFGTQLFNKFAGPASFAGAAIGAGKFFQTQAKGAEDLKRTAKAIDLTTDSLQKFDLAADKKNVPREKVKEGINEIRKTQSEALMGEQGPIKEYARIGITLDELKKKSADEIFLKISRGIESGAINAANFASVLKVMGGGAKDLIGVFKDGFAGTVEEIEKAGPVIRRGIIDNLAEANKGMHGLWETTKGWGSYLKANIAGGLLGLGKLAKAGIANALARAGINADEESKRAEDALVERELMFDKGNDASLNNLDRLQARKDKQDQIKREKSRQDEEKKAEQAKKDAEEAAKLAEKNKQTLADMRFNALAKPQQLDELTRRRDGLLADMETAKTPLEREKMKAELLETQQKLSTAQSSSAGGSSLSFSRPSDSLSRIGGTRGSSANADAEISARRVVENTARISNRLESILVRLESIDRALR